MLMRCIVPFTESRLNTSGLSVEQLHSENLGNKTVKLNNHLHPICSGAKSFSVSFISLFPKLNFMD